MLNTHNVTKLDFLIEKRKHVLAIFLFLAITYYRMIFLLGDHVNTYIYDENQWTSDLKSYNFFDYFTKKDAGYFVFIHRLLLYAMNVGGNLEASKLHLFAAIIASACSVSLIFLLNKDFNTSTNIFLSILIGVYPTFDLLTWMNISYYIFIPTTILILKLDFSRKVSVIKFVCLCILVLSVAKPQLLLALGVLLLIINIVSLQHARKFNLSMPILIIVCSLFIASRLNSPLETSNNLKNIAHFFINIVYIPISVLVPTISALLFGYLKMLNIGVFELAFKVIMLFCSVFFFYRLRKTLSQVTLDRKLYIIGLFAVVLTLYLSFFADSSSPIGNAFFWNINCRTCVFDRHIFPFFVTLVMLILFIIQKVKLINFFLLSLLIQEIFVTYFAYDYLFNLVLKV